MNKHGSYLSYSAWRNLCARVERPIAGYWFLFQKAHYLRSRPQFQSNIESNRSWHECPRAILSRTWYWVKLYPYFLGRIIILFDFLRPHHQTCWANSIGSKRKSPCTVCSQRVSQSWSSRGGPFPQTLAWAASREWMTQSRPFHRLPDWTGPNMRLSISRRAD